jgi:C4-dicarboxylate transporter DctM subunit
MFFLLIVGVPIAVSIGVSSKIFSLWIPGGIDRAMILVAQKMIVTPIPSRCSRCLLHPAGTPLSNAESPKNSRTFPSRAGDFPGGLGIAAIVACMFFAAVSGSGPATVAAIGSIMISAMNERGYDKGFTGGLLACGGGIGVLIPPSIPMIVYAVTTGVSVTDLFIAGVIPGGLVGVVLMLLTYVMAKKRNYVGAPRQGGALWVMGRFWEAKWALLVPIIILGGIYSGVFTPTEAGVVAVVYAIVLGFITRAVCQCRTLQGDDRGRRHHGLLRDPYGRCGRVREVPVRQGRRACRELITSFTTDRSRFC